MSDKVRVFEIAEEVGKTSVEVMQKAKELGIVSKKDITYGLLEEKGGNLSITTGEEKMEKYL